MGDGYERFWDLHIISSGGEYDFADQIAQQADYQQKKHKNEYSEYINYIKIKNNNKIDANNPNSGSNKDPPAGPGLVVSAATTDELISTRPNAVNRKLIQWISDIEFCGKLRINAHGDGRGNIYMPPDHDKVNAQNIVRWLAAGGLSQGMWDPDAGKVMGGLATLCMAVCMGAMHEKEAPLWSNQKNAYVASDLSAIGRVAKSLGMLGNKFVRVTGSNELVVTHGEWSRRNPFGMGMLDGWEFDMVQAADPENPRPRLPVDCFRVDRNDQAGWARLVVPSEFSVRTQKRQCVIFLPRAWEIDGTDATRGPGGGGWVVRRKNAAISILEGFIVDEDDRKIVLPLGFAIGGAAGRIVDSTGNWQVSSHNSMIWRGAYGRALRLAGTDYKIVAIS